MKNLIVLAVVTALFSCSTKEGNTNILENLSFTVDTVVVDAGEDFIVLTYGLNSQNLSPDKSRLYFFESDPLQFLEVDLDQLKLLKKTPFDKEGPDGVGSYFLGFQMGPEEQMMINGYSSLGLFDKKGKKTRDLKFVPEGISQDLAQNPEALYQSVVYDFDKELLYTQPSFQSVGAYGLFVLDPKAKTAKSLPIPKMKIVDDLSGTLKIESGGGVAHYYFSVQKFTAPSPEGLIISTAALSGLYQYDAKKDSVRFYDIQHQTMPNVMNTPIDKNPTDMDALEGNRRMMEEHINYLQVHWDETRKMYFRLGKKTFRGETKEDPSKFELFLFAYDQDFKVLGETKLEGLDANMHSYFFKDGKLWSYVNVDDELGFAVMTLDF